MRSASAGSSPTLTAGSTSPLRLRTSWPGCSVPFGTHGRRSRPTGAAIADVIRAPLVFVAEEDDEIVGVLRGRRERLASLFVRGDRHRRGIGRRLVEQFEQECVRRDVTLIRVAATLYAIPFYSALGYRRTTGIRNGWSFEGTGLRYQPMKKVLHG